MLLIMGRTLCSSDWHGSELGFKVLDYLQPDDTLYFLGDAQDRGDYGIKLMNKLLLDPRIVYIKGNHDEMMANAVVDLVDNSHSTFFEVHWFGNGGTHTWDSMIHMSNESKMWYVDKINDMPTEIIYHSPKGHDVILEHAGFSPFNIQTHEHNPLWDREHFDDKWFGERTYLDLDPNITYLVHGHTPVQYLTYDYNYNGKNITIDEAFIKAQRAFFQDCDVAEYCPKPEIIRYCEGHKFDIDMCTISSDRIALLDLDTFETIYFDAEEK